MKEKFTRFMIGRYGNDRLNQFLLIVSIIFLVFSFLGGKIFYVITLFLLVFAYYRMFSRKIYKRAAENQWYIKREMKVRSIFLKKKNEMKIRKTHHIYKCPSCKQKIRIPRGKGKIEIKCPKCKTAFIKKS